MESNIKESLKKVVIFTRKVNKFVFLFEIDSLINEEYIIGNIDETIFSRSIKNNNYWSFKISECNAINSSFVDSFSQLIPNKGVWFI